MAEDTVTINLTRDEALVLFEFLSRFSEEEKLQIKDSSEERVLWDIHCLLEKTLADPLKPNYAELLVRAQKRLRGEE